MTRVKSLIAGTVAVIVGVTIGLTDAFSAAARTAEADGRTAHFVLEAVSVPPLPPRETAPEAPPEPAVLETQVGSASFYASSLAGRRTASGVRYDPRKMVAAHRTLPFGSRLRVTNEANGRSVEVKVVDRGPFARGRVLDLSRTAAEELDFIRRGHTRVTIEVLEYGGQPGTGS